MSGASMEDFNFKIQAEKIGELRRTINFLCKQMMLASDNIGKGEIDLVRLVLSEAVGDIRYDFF